MTSFNTVIGDTSWSETKSVSVKRQNGTTYTESFTHSAAVPTSSTREKQTDVTDQSWKAPTSDNSSFKAIKESGIVKMTDYDVGRRSTAYHVVALPRVSECYVKRGAYTTYNNKFYDRSSYLFDHTCRYSLQADYYLLQEMFPDAPSYFHQNPLGEIDEKINDVMGRVVTDLSSSYDLMTEVMEFKQSVEFVSTLLSSAISPVRTIRKLIKSGKIRQVGDWWLQYRYGIMPLVYSVQDIVKTLNERNAIYRTARAANSVNLSLGKPEDTGVTCFYDTYDASTSIRGVGKERITGDDLTRLYHRVATNPMLTAWELTPFSFVVDWFVNVSDWVVAQSSILSNIGTDRNYCYSVKVSKKRRIYFRDNHDSRCTLVTGPWTVNPYGDVFPQSTRAGGLLNKADYEVVTFSEDSYTRRVFQPTQVALAVSPFLNWKRWADGTALSVSKTRDLLRRKS